jgi:hypothetical protein
VQALKYGIKSLGKPLRISREKRAKNKIKCHLLDSSRKHMTKNLIGLHVYCIS